MTLRYLANDCLTTLKENNVSADLTLQHVIFWCATICNKYKLKNLGKTNFAGGNLDVFTGIPVLTSTSSTNPNLVAGRKYVVLPESIFNIEDERGISYISHEQGADCEPGWMQVTFESTTPAKAKVLKYSPYTTPSRWTVYYYVLRNYVYFLGLEGVTVSSLEMGLHTSINTKTNLLNPDDEIDLQEEDVTAIRRELLQLGSFMIVLPKDRTVNSNDETQGKPAPVPQQAQ